MNSNSSSTIKMGKLTNKTMHRSKILKNSKSSSKIRTQDMIATINE